MSLLAVWWFLDGYVLVGILQPDFPMVWGQTSHQVTVSYRHVTCTPWKAVEVSSSLALSKPDGPNPASGTDGSTRGHLLKAHCMVTRWLIQMGCIDGFCSSISLEATGWRNEEGCSPICQYSLIHHWTTCLQLPTSLAYCQPPLPLHLFVPCLTGRNSALYLMHTWLYWALCSPSLLLHVQIIISFSFYIHSSLLISFPPCLLRKDLH